MTNYLYHYTDLHSLLGIIGTNLQELTFWGSRFDCMNDPLDYQWAKNKILPTMMDVAKKIAREQNLPKEVLTDIKTHPYIVSFSKKRDDFLMWRMYDAKVALILDKKYFDKITPNSALIECVYSNDDPPTIRDAFLKIDKQISDCLNVSANVSRITTFIKEEAFATEGEVRLATWDYFDTNDNKVTLSDCIDNESIVDRNTQSRVNNKGKIILYKRFHIDKKALAGIFIHSYNQLEFESLKNILKTLLINLKYSREVFNNIIPTNAYPFNL